MSTRLKAVKYTGGEHRGQLSRPVPGHLTSNPLLTILSKIATLYLLLSCKGLEVPLQIFRTEKSVTILCSCSDLSGWGEGHLHLLRFLAVLKNNPSGECSLKDVNYIHQYLMCT
jgi:hypothetical protein